MSKEQKTYYRIIALNIRRLRTEGKLSQEKLAERLGCSREFISRVENQKERVSLAMLLNIAELFKVNPSSMFKG